MRKGTHFLIVILVSTASFVTAQTTSTIRLQVLTSELQKIKKPQSVSVEIQVDEPQPVTEFKLVLDRITAKLTPVRVRLNGVELWLINSKSGTTNDKVLTWNFDSVKSELHLLPGKWRVPYVLEMDLQVDLLAVDEIAALSSATFNLQAEVSGRSLEVSATGRGKNISLK